MSVKLEFKTLGENGEHRDIALIDGWSIRVTCTNHTIIGGVRYGVALYKDGIEIFNDNSMSYRFQLQDVISLIKLYFGTDKPEVKTVLDKLY